jgi:hypothetical protein
VIKVTEKERLLAEAHELDKENENTTGERRLEIGKRLGEIQERLGQIIPEQNAGNMYEER